jgi:hypothetical protein
MENSIQELAKKILSDITGYTIEELTDRNTEPMIQAEDCLTAMYRFLRYHQTIIE